MSKQNGFSVGCWLLSRCLQILTLVPSAPLMLYAATHGPPALLRGDFSYWPVRDSLVTTLTCLLFLVSLGYFLVAFGAVAARLARLVPWTVSAGLYPLFPTAHLVDPRPVSFPAPVAYGFAFYLLALSVLSAVAFLFAYRECQPKVA